MDPAPASRPEESLRPLYFHHLGTDAALPCPDCGIPLAVIEFEIVPPTRIERCASCEGLFFNPGELEVLLETGTTPLLWLDPDHFEIAARGTPAAADPFPKKCPVCSERMTQSNFGGCSAVMLDHCHFHGFWVEGNEMRRLRDWWRAGGKRLHQHHSSASASASNRPEPGSPECDALFGTSPGKNTDLGRLASFISSLSLLG